MITTPDPLGLTHDVYADYGLLGLVILLVVFFVLPALVKKVFPFLLKGWQDERKRAELREERQVKAMESLATSNQAISVTLSAMDVRLNNVQLDVDVVKLAVLRDNKSKRRKLQAVAGD